MTETPAPYYAQNTSGTRRAITRWLPFAALAGFLAAVRLAPLENWPSMCWSRNISGTPCPSCGIGRSLHALLHLRIGDSLHYHPLLLPYLIATGMLVVYYKRKAAAGKSPSAAFWLSVVGLAGVVALAVWYYRLTNGLIP